MADGLGYWIYMTQAETLHLTGGVFAPPPTTPPTYTLTGGWNMLGFKPQPDSAASDLVSVYLASITGSYDPNNVWVYNGSWVRATGSTSLTPSEGMWILMTAPATLRP